MSEMPKVKKFNPAMLNALGRRLLMAFAPALISGAIVFIPVTDARADESPASSPACRAALDDMEKAVLPDPDTDVMAEAAEIAFFAEDGSEVRLKDYRGQGVVLNFWAVWCAPCVREMPALDRMHASLEGEKVAVLAVSQDRKGVPMARNFYDVNDIKNLAVQVDRNSALIRALGARGLPTTLLIDPLGREVARVEGEWHWDSDEAIGLAKACLSPKVPS